MVPVVMAMELSPSLPLLQASRSSRSLASRSSLSLAMAGRPYAALADFTHDQFASSSSSSSPSIPMLEPFSRSRVSRLTREPSLLDKAEHAISDRCSILEGDDAYQCWEALFEFEDMKEEYRGRCRLAAAGERQAACRPLERLENFVRQSGGAAALIDSVRMLARANKAHNAAEEAEPSKQEEALIYAADTAAEYGGGARKDRYTPEPGSYPPTDEELELRRSAMMPESSFTRVLRAMGIPSPWLSQPTVGL